MSRILVLLVCIIAGHFGVNSQVTQLSDDEEFSCQPIRQTHELETLSRTRPTGTIKSPCYDSKQWPNELPSGYKVVNLTVTDEEEPVIGYDMKIVDFNITARNRLYIGGSLATRGPIRIVDRNWTMIVNDTNPFEILFYYNESPAVNFTKMIGDTVRFNTTSVYMDYYTIDDTEFVKGFLFNYTTVSNVTTTTALVTAPVITTQTPSDISSSTTGTTSSATAGISSFTTGKTPYSSTSSPPTSSNTTTTKDTPTQTDGFGDYTTPQPTTTLSCYVSCCYYTATIVLGVLLVIAIWLILVLAVLLMRKNGSCCSCPGIGAWCGKFRPCGNCCRDES